ncbi:MAG: WYL domain-containing protein [Sporichthyaceae bacterium]|nr:WYL domain-containing protein [Sporichthyaceae bacterium]
MSPRPGRDQSAPMERLVRLIGALNQHPKGAPVHLLLRLVGEPDANDEARRRMLTRDLEQLNNLGYDIRNVADPGADGLYVMRARDNRLQIHLTPEQRGALLRAAIAAGLEGMSAHLGTGPATGSLPPPSTERLDLVQRATTRHCLVHFDYKGEPRAVHPVRVHSGPSGWYLSGREDLGDGPGIVKEFVVSRMSGVRLDAPGTADVVEAPPRPSLDPLTWLLDPPTAVTVEAPAEHRLLVENLLGDPSALTDKGDSVRMTYVVTNRAVFRWRVYELGTRVRVLGPDDVRREIQAELESFLVDTT